MSLPAGWYTDHADANVERYWDGAAWGTGPDAVRGQPAGRRQGEGSFPVLVADPVPKPSAPLLVGGLLCIILGPGFAALFGGGLASGATLAFILGSLVGVVGLVLLVMGVDRLASGVDYLVSISAGRERDGRG